MTPEFAPDNLLAIDYDHAATQFTKLPYGIIDIHSHIGGKRAVELYQRSARLYGVKKTVSMTHPEGIPDVRAVLGDSVEFVAIPNWSGADPYHEHLNGYHDRLKNFWGLGARIAKFWSAPRIFDHHSELPAHRNPLRLNSPERKATIKTALDLGFKIMVHVSDPDTWFATKYADSSRYGSKDWHYEAFEEILEMVAPRPLLAAHMAGSPENLSRLERLLGKYPHLYLDCSATKWQVRELSKHDPETLRSFFSRWRGRILFGSDIVTAEEHLTSGQKRNEMLAKASSETSAYELYASRYWAFRTLFETEYDGPSPIVDPDLAMVDPRRYGPRASPLLRGIALDSETLKVLYHDGPKNFLAL